ncbi:Acetyltransferase (fragment) [Hyella patelloides LEGE 07179]|uniref:Acetyltransferase n=1 Tax=Hyella patelloides LEGE 07179 TaxID=945734 RepID=A0A563VXZ7_9CYAN
MKFLTVRNVTQYDLENVINSLILAFCADPVIRWMYPSPQQYLENFPNFVRTFGHKALELKTVYTIDDYSGAAFWFPPHTEPESEAVGEMLQRTISQQLQEEVFTMLEKISHDRPQEPHWYLGILGVEPTQRQKGYGSALM